MSQAFSLLSTILVPQISDVLIADYVMMQMLSCHNTSYVYANAESCFAAHAKSDNMLCVIAQV